MKKIITTVFFILFISAFVYAETIQKNDVTVEYEISGRDIYAKVFIKELEKPYEIHIFIDDKINPEYKDIGFVSTNYYNPRYTGVIYYIKINTIDEICSAIMFDLNDKKIIPALKNKTTVIIYIIENILIESGLCIK